MRRPCLFAASALSLLLAIAAANLLPAGDSPADKKDRVSDTVELAGTWIYDDLPAGIAQARREGKPLFIVFR